MRLKKRSESAILQTMNFKKLLLLLLLLFLVIFIARKYLLAALVNGKIISRAAVIKELEKQGGKKVLDSLISRELILQEAKRKNISVKPTEVDAEYKKIEKSTSKQGQNLDQLLAFQGMSKDDLKNQLFVQLTLKKLLADKVKVSDKEVNDYISKSNNPLENPKKMDKNQVRSQLQNQKLQSEAEKLVESLRKKAKIMMFVN